MHKQSKQERMGSAGGPDEEVDSGLARMQDVSSL